MRYAFKRRKKEKKRTTTEKILDQYATQEKKLV